MHPGSERSYPSESLWFVYYLFCFTIYFAYALGGMTARVTTLAAILGPQGPARARCLAPPKAKGNSPARDYVNVTITPDNGGKLSEPGIRLAQLWANVIVGWRVDDPHYMVATIVKYSLR